MGRIGRSYGDRSKGMKGARGFVIAIIATALILGTSGSALGSGGTGPDSHASCVGILTWANTHHVEGFPTRADLAHFVKIATAGRGLPPGAFFSFAARLHLDSIKACNAALP